MRRTHRYLFFIFLSLIFIPACARGKRPEPEKPLLTTGSFASNKAVPNVDRFRIVTYNLRGPLGDRIDDMMEVLKEHPALKDTAIFALQEVNRFHRFTANKDMASEFAKGLGMHYGYAVESSYKKGGGVRGLAILSRYPLSEVERIQLPHQGPDGRRPIALGASVQLGHKRLRVYSLHLTTRISAGQRGDQINAILENAERYSELPMVLLGDFNTIKESGRKKMFALLQSAGFTCPMPGNQKTFQRGLIVRLKLDWIWVRKLNVTQWKIEDDVMVSDHRPIWADLTFQDSAAQTARRFLSSTTIENLRIFNCKLKSYQSVCAKTPPSTTSVVPVM